MHKQFKLRFFSAVCAFAALCMVSCSQDDALQTTVNDTDGLVPVTLSATIDHGVQTRAATSETDDDATRCLLQIIEDDNTTTTKREVQTMTLGADGSYIATAMLNPNNTYTFLFWADDGSYTATDLEAVTIAGEASEAGIAWYGSASWSSSESTEIKATLTHAVTKVTLQSTTAVPATMTATISGVKEYSTFNVADGTVAGETTTYTHSGKGTDEAGDVFSFYALVSDETQNLTLQTGDQPEVSISSVPLAPNKHVILSGDVANAGLTEFTFTATINEVWKSSTTEYLEDYTVDADGTTYTIYTAAGLQAWASHVNAGNWSTNCTLAADIDMTGQEWVRIGNNSSGQNYNGTFDGAGHTISNLKGGSALIHSGSGCTIKNVVLDNPEITATDSYVGGIIGYMGGSNASITNCHVIGGTISCNASLAAYAGGICSIIANNAIISACSSTATVSATTTGNNTVCAGGLVGALDGGTLTASYYAGQGVTASGGLVRYVGGVAGVIFSTATACYWSSDGVTQGVGYGSDNTTKVDDEKTTWSDAAKAMNEKLTDYQWEVTGDTDVPLKLVSE